ncbi:TetR/AcrR family transcriptional regulator [Mycobacterium parmense]|uniref:HTH-type transcriptional repressor n=1 Tax=Mycobacterium parmense TaxID=185642 RepID=A0A7I7YV05_9MYCO|nr:TetR/AcrR family transcriptional regulator [Mycobacterium parmense]MCV7350866.1 helix-turn-helix transcriptional regulator [Mycobacterium parmense]ORW48542.1 TetR family transcriptional regulator [Mycobacterium parmense]BBZ45705.1 HTH-type transcriptional repressor [Mycobacterium parmense]
MTTRSATPKSPAGRAAPVGREAVAAAVLEAATELFAERGPAATSIRDIAARSKVNHGLVFRHFGTKEQLVGAVLDHLGATTTALLQTDPSAAEVERALDRHMRVMARTLLDGYPAGKLQSRFPGASQLFDRVRPMHDDDRSARLAVANAFALQLGWRLFAPFLRSAAGLEDMADAELGEAVSAEVQRLVQPH